VRIEGKGGLDTKTLMNCNPILILSGFNADQLTGVTDDCRQWLDLTSSMFTSMFPSQELQTLNPNNIKRCV
jgi:hypothetical protein